MNLIKKTIILTGVAAEGYVSVIRVGNDVGAKIVGSDFQKGMRAGLKIGRSETIFAELDGPKTEIAVDGVPFHQNDGIGCVVMRGDLAVARGGTAVKSADVVKYFSSLPSRPVEQTAVPTPAASSEEETLSSENGDNGGADKDADLTADDGAPEDDGALGDKTDGAKDGVREETSSDGAETAEERVPSSGETDGEARSILDKLSAKDGAEFYNGIREKVEELFVVYPRESELNSLIPDSEWVKITYDGEDYYVVGRISENGRTVLLGYGVPGRKTVTPPKIADEIASWLTVPGLTGGYDGYWLIFQDAVNGKVVPAN